jgi:hypothetical protein
VPVKNVFLNRKRTGPLPLLAGFRQVFLTFLSGLLYDFRERGKTSSH